MTPSLTTKPQDLAAAAGSPSALSVRWALAGLALATALSSLGASIAHVALPTLMQVFAVNFSTVQWVVLAYLLASTALIVGAGRLGDMLGRRRLLLAGIGLFVAGSLGGGLAPTLGWVIAARALQGLGAAIMLALSMALVGDIASSGRTGAAIGLLGTMSALGTALGPSLGGLLLSGFGWRSLFLVNVPLGLLAAGLLQRHLSADRPISPSARKAFDGTGTLLLALTLASYALAVTWGRGSWSMRNLSLLLTALAAAGLFVFVVQRTAAPLIPLATFRDRRLRASLAMNALVATVMMTTLVVGPFYLARTVGLSPFGVGLALSVGPVVAALTGVPAGRLTDRWGSGYLIAVGLAAMAAGCGLLLVLPTALGLPGYLGPIILITAGYGFFQTANNTAVMTGVSPERRGVVSGLLNLSRNFGLITGASVMGAVFAWVAGTAEFATASPEAVAGSMRVTFGAAGLLILVALALRSADLSSVQFGAQ
ncbi:MAG TPA: MFS transporter [Opitutaceae bacterium]